MFVFCEREWLDAIQLHQTLIFSGLHRQFLIKCIKAWHGLLSSNGGIWVK